MLTRVIAVAIVCVVAFGTGIAFAGGDEEPRAVSESNAPEYVKLPTQSVAGAIQTQRQAGCNQACKVRNLTRQVAKLTKFNKCIAVIPVGSYGEDSTGGDYGFLWRDDTVPSEFLTTALDWTSAKKGEWMLVWKRSCH